MALRSRMLLSRLGDMVLDLHDHCFQTRFGRLHRLVRPYTLCGNARLRGLFRAVHEVVERNVPGDVVECGTAQGGSAALLGLALQQLGADRLLWVFDSLEGLPAPTADDPDQQLAQRHTGTCRAELVQVQALMARLGLLGQCQLIKGAFRHTVPSCSVGRIALLHLDCDWYESVKICLESLYDRVSAGGVIQIDDYGHWAGAQKAVDEFLRDRSIRVPLRALDYTGRQFIKPSG